MKNYSKKYLGKEVKIKIDRQINKKHPTHEFIYELNYGFVPNTKAPDGEEIDAYLLGVEEQVKEFTGRCIAIVQRQNDDDDKLIIVPEGKKYTNKQIKNLISFQEKFFKIKIIR